jgi:hypothetical protein
MESVLKTRTVYLSKDWYVYYKFIDDSTGKWNACPILKLEQIDTKQKGKATDSDPLRDALAYLLEKVWILFRSRSNVLNDEKTDSKQRRLTIIKPQPEVVAFIEPEVIAIEEPIMTIKEAFELRWTSRSTPE